MLKTLQHTLFRRFTDNYIKKGKKMCKRNFNRGLNKSPVRLKKVDMAAWILCVPFIFGLYFFQIRPIIIGLSYSFCEMKGFSPIGFAGLDNFISVIRDTAFIKTLINTVMYTVWSLVIGFWVPIFVAVIVNELVHFRGTLKVMMYLPCIVPSLAASLIWYFFYLPGQAGVLNQVILMFGGEPQVWLQDKNLVIPLIIISMTWRGFGSTVVFYLAALQGINQELYEAARIDGAGIITRVKTIALPHLAPIALLMFVKQIIGIFQIQSEPMLMTGGGPNGASLSLNLQSYYYMFNYFQTERALALGAITFVILMIANIFYFRIEKKLEIY